MSKNFYDLFPKPGPVPPPEPNGQPVDPARVSRYAEAALESEVANVRSAAQGTRNATLNKAGFAIGQLVAAGHISASVAWQALAVAGVEAGLGNAEVDKTLRSSLGAGTKQPRMVALHEHEPQVIEVPALEATGPDPGAEEAAAEAVVRYNQAVAVKANELRVLQAARDRLDAERRGPGVELPPLTRLDEFLAVPDEDVTHRVAGLLPIGGRAVLSAANKAGKTTLVGNLLRCLADGDPFLDRFETVPANRVVLVDDELDERMLRRWLRDHGIVNAATVELVTLRGRLSSFDILDPSTRQRWAEHLGPADVLVLDCLRPALDALGLSEDKDAGRFLEALDELTTAAGIGEALVIHHMGHNGERSRGDSRILDWPDAVWRLVRGPEEHDGPADQDRQVYFTAYGRDVDQPEVLLGFDPDTRRLHVVGGSRRDVRVDQVLEPLLDLLAEVGTLTGRDIERRMTEAGHPLHQVRGAIKRGIGLGVITMEYGPRNAHLHSLSASVRHTASAVRQRTQGECVSASIETHSHSLAVEPASASGDALTCSMCGQPPTDKTGLGARGLCAQCETAGGRP